jgi:DNA-binding winged helix-turn-helix (wHTH) protein
MSTIDLPSAPGGRVYGNLELRPDELQAFVDGRRLGLTVREFQVLAVLAEREDRVVRRNEIYLLVWGDEMKHRDRSVDVFVRKLRTKLAMASPGWTYIHTHFAIGYRFAPAPLTPPEAASSGGRFSRAPEATPEAASSSGPEPSPERASVPAP